MVFTKIFRRLIFVLSGCLCLSCSAYRICQVEVLQPASLQLEQGKRVVLIDRNIHFNTGSLTVKGEIPELEESNLYRQFADGMNAMIEETGHLDSLRTLEPGQTVLLNEGNFPPHLSQDSIRRICQAAMADYVASIEIQYYSVADSYLKNNWLLCLYDPDSVNIVDSVFLRTVVAAVDDVPEDVLNNIIASFGEQGATYAWRLVPFWAETERRIYNNGKLLRLGDFLLRDNKTEEAIKIWTAALQLSPKTAVRAGINLAWIYENAGDFEQALDILKQMQTLATKEKLNNDVTVYLGEYMQVIKKRIKEFQLLISAENKDL